MAETLVFLREIHSPEKLLWTSVIYQMLDDAVFQMLAKMQRGRIFSKTIKATPTMAYNSRLARLWFEKQSSGFSEVCDFAGLNQNHVMENCRDIIHRFDRVVCVVRKPTDSYVQRRAKLSEIGTMHG